VVAAMMQDKKNTGDQVTFILSRGPGIMEKVAMDAREVPSFLDGGLELL
jgi:hypothetical protein